MRRYIEIPIEITDIKGDGFHIFIEGHINNKPARFVVDTGASKTIFDKKRILDFIDNPEFNDKDSISTGIGGNDISSSVFQLNSLCLNGLEINDFIAVAIDLSNINDSYKTIDLPPIDGALGGDILKEYDAIINYKLKKIRLTPKF